VIKLDHTSTRYGGLVTVTGTTSATAAGQRIVLQFSPKSGGFAPIASATVGGNGSFRMRTKVYRSGLLRVVGTSSPTTTVTYRPGLLGTRIGSTTSTTTTPGVALSSASQPITVYAQLLVPSATINALSGSPLTLHGRLLASRGGHIVELQGRLGGHWQTLASARTGSSGRFTLRYTATGLGSEPLRVRFAGDASSAHAITGAGLLTVYRQAVASWYNDAGSTACGFHATMGVASPGLPCGSKVTFLYGGRRVTATVDDRGPFVAGRSWDLNQNTAGALGFAGVATVWATE
jgi:hypothetical protein